MFYILRLISRTANITSAPRSYETRKSRNLAGNKNKSLRQEKSAGSKFEDIILYY